LVIISATKSLILSAKGEKIGLLVILRNITEMKKNEQAIIDQARIVKEKNSLLEQRQTVIEKQSEELTQSNSELKRLNATKDRFFSIIAHDLRNPFNALVGISELLVQQFRQFSNEEIQNYLNIIYTSSQSGHELLENLLQWSRAQTGHINYEPIPLSLKAVVFEIVALLEGEALHKKIHLQVEIREDVTINADENMLQTVLRNLVSNAIKFTNSGGKVTIDADVADDFAVVSVTDNGVGISKDDLQNLFKEEQTYTTPGTQDETGSGLGLLLCKEFIEHHGGNIRVESEKGKGSSFIFTLPLMK
jgi:two-component system sensor histidine kinase/response regulator